MGGVFPLSRGVTSFPLVKEGHNNLRLLVFRHTLSPSPKGEGEGPVHTKHHANSKAIAKAALSSSNSEAMLPLDRV
jgi:hypothetical protein